MNITPVIEAPPIFYVNQYLLLLGHHHCWSLWGVGLWFLHGVCRLHLQLFQLPNLVVLLTQSMPVPYVDIGPSSSVANRDCPRPNLVPQTSNSVDQIGSLLLSYLAHRDCLPSDDVGPISSEAHSLVRLILWNSLEPLNHRIFLAQLSGNCLFLLFWQFGINVVWASSLVEDVRVHVNPGIEGIELSNFCQFKLILELNDVGILFIGFVQSFGSQFATMRYSSHNTF